MGGPLKEVPEGSEQRTPRSDLVLVEAGESRERRCADCGRRTPDWKPVRRRGMSVILCGECASKPAPAAPDETCPTCGAALRLGDRFCGKCGSRIEYGCPACGSALDADDSFCGKCGARLA